MPKIKADAFQCSRCEHIWMPRDAKLPPQVCPSCKSPYWDRPRLDDVKPDHRIRVSYQAHELDHKTVEFSLVRKGKTEAGFGHLSVTELGKGLVLATIKVPRIEKAEVLEDVLFLNQEEANQIKRDYGRRVGFRCVFPPKPEET